MLTKPGSFAIYAANQTLMCWGLQQRKGLFSRQPSEEISLRSTSQKMGTLFIYGIKLRYGECEERWLEMRKKWENYCSAKAYLSYTLLLGMCIQNMAAWTRSEGGVLSPQMSKGYGGSSGVPNNWGSGRRSSSVLTSQLIPSSWTTQANIYFRLQASWRICKSLD